MHHIDDLETANDLKQLLKNAIRIRTVRHTSEGNHIDRMLRTPVAANDLEFGATAMLSAKLAANPDSGVVFFCEFRRRARVEQEGEFGGLHWVALNGRFSRGYWVSGASGALQRFKVVPVSPSISRLIPRAKSFTPSQ